jgi:hypothetical protein
MTRLELALLIGALCLGVAHGLLEALFRLVCPGVRDPLGRRWS